MQKRSENSSKVFEASKGLGANAKRRALGDITNAVRADDVKEKVLKKPVLQPAVRESSNSMIIAETVYDVDRNDTEDRVYMQRQSDNIDARDAGNPLLVTEYVDEMYDYHRKVEVQMKVDSSYMRNIQPNINDKMRSILIDWLVDVHMKFKMVPETLYVTINFIDRYLQVKEVRRSRLQLVGVSALLLAAKYEEIYAPDLRELVHITDNAYNKDEILAMELDIVLTLNHYCTVPTAHTFLCRYLKAAHADRTMVQLSCYLAERSLQEMSSLHFLPSTIAATAILLARKTLKRHPWSPTLLRYTEMDEIDLQPCIDDMRSYLKDSLISQQQAVFRKYSGPKFGSVAQLEIVY